MRENPKEPAKRPIAKIINRRFTEGALERRLNLKRMRVYLIMLHFRETISTSYIEKCQGWHNES